MKRILVCLCLIIGLFAGSASAERIVFKDPQFGFGDYKTMQLTNVSLINVDTKDFVTDPTAESKVVTALRGAMAKKGVTVRTPDQIPASTPGIESLKSIPEVSVKVYCIGYDNIYRNAWTETRRVMETYTGQLGWSWNKMLTVTVPRTQKIEHPAGYYHNAEVDMEINVINPYTKAVVYTVRDSRGEGNSTNTTNLLLGICKDFSKDVK
jgi:hypothetical protein